VKYNGEEFTVYNRNNSGLPEDDIWALEIDDLDRIWIGTWGGGLAMLKGEEWTIFDTDNSGLPSNHICSIEISNNDIWVGTYTGGLVRYDGINWHIWDTWNSEIPHDHVHNFTFDREGNIWTTHFSEGDLGKFKGLDWETYNSGNSALTGQNIRSINTDAYNRIWIGGQHHGVIILDGEQWHQYNTNNSGLTSNHVVDISFDELGNTWLSTASGGVTIFREGGIAVSSEDESERYAAQLPTGYRLYQNYPNPFNPATTIPFSLPNRDVVKIEIYNLAGQRVAVLADREFASGRHELHWDAAGFASGVYIYRMQTTQFLETGKLTLVK